MNHKLLKKPQSHNLVLTQEEQDKQDKFQQEYEKMQDKEESRLKSHLETFNDGVIAIIITIMVLEIPLPLTGAISYGGFLRTLFVFFISFFIVANFWYQHHRSFGLIKRANRSILLINFLFLATLSIIPIMTKWIMQEPDSFAIANFGVVYFIVSITELFLYRSAFMSFLGKSERGFHFSNRITMIRIWGQLLLNIFLILLALKWPQVTMVLYLSMPIISFFFPNQFNVRRQKKVRVKAALKYEKQQKKDKE